MGDDRPLLDRENQLATLAMARGQAASGSGQLVLISGEAGIGKSALVTSFCDSVRSECRVLVGRCDPLSTPRPLGPVLDMSPHLGSRLQVLIAAGDKPQLVFAETLSQLAAEPTVAVFEDMHWADEATLDLLRFLGRRIESTHAMLVCTFRDEDFDSLNPLQVAIGDLASASEVTRLRLPPLGMEAVRKMVGDRRLEVSKLHALTAGNPFFVTEILSSPSEELPPSIRDATLARAARLSVAARTALDAAAVMGERFSADALQITFDLADSALSECFNRGFLISTADGVSFRHQLTRKALLEAVESPRRTRLHSQVVSAMKQRGIVPSELATIVDHAENAGDGGTVLEFAASAAAWASRLGAHREAAAQYARAVRFANGLGDSERARLIRAMADEQSIFGDNELAAKQYRSATVLWRRAGEVAQEADTLRRLSRSLWRLGEFDEASALADEAVRMLEGRPAGRELAWAFANKAHLMSVCDRYRESKEWASQALDLSQRLGDRELVVYALNDLGIAKLWLGDAGGAEDLETSARLSEEFGYEDHMLRAHCNLAVAAVERYEVRRATELLIMALGVSSRYELSDLDAHLIATRALARLHSGHWLESREDADTVLTRRVTLPPTSIMALLARGLTNARLGRVRQSAGDLDRAFDLVTKHYPPLKWRIRLALAEAAWLRGNHPAASAHADASVRERLGDQLPVFAAECNYWRWRSGAPVDLSQEMDGPFASMVRGGWRDAAKDWEQRGCPYEAAIALMECQDPAAVQRATQILENLGAKPALAMARQRLRRLGVTTGHRGARRSTRAHPAGLTQREAEVLTLMGEGYTNPEIAQRLFLAPKTVEHHVTSILNKLGVKNRLEAVRRADSELLSQKRDRVEADNLGVSGSER